MLRRLRIVRSVLFIVILLISSHSTLFAQIPWTERCWSRIGDYQHFYEAWGWSYSWNGNYYEGMQWPALYEYSDNYINKRPYIGLKNWTAADGNLWDTYVWGISAASNPLIATPILLKETYRFEKPHVYVNEYEINPSIDDINPNQPADKMITNIVNTNLGITIKRRVLAFSQQDNDDYHILEYTFKNTGNVDADDSLELAGQNIEQFYYGEMVHYATSREAQYTPIGNQQSWGIAQWITFRGETYSDYVSGSGSAQPEDSLRAAISWLGRRGSNYVAYDNIGAPDIQNDGRLVSPQFIGQVILHVDTGPGNPQDDPEQPVTRGWQSNDLHPNVIGPPTEDRIAEYNRGYTFLEGEMYLGHHGIPQYQGDTTDMWEVHKDSVKYPESLVGGAGAAGVLSFGPYDIPFGDSIKIVRAEGVNGLSREKCEEIGGLWLQAHDSAGVTFDFPMPDGSVLTGSYGDGDIGENSADQFKDAWVMTGMDSVLKVFGKAKHNYESGYNIPQPPPPPSAFHVSVDSPNIKLQWNSTAEDYPGFEGYKIFRAQGRYDTTYQQIFECGLGGDSLETIHTFIDSNVTPNTEYYYYIISYGTQNGKTLHSSLYLTRTTEPAILYTTGTAPENLITQFNLAQNYPNPFNPTTTITFDIPRRGRVRLKVYDISGRLVRKLVDEVKSPGSYKTEFDGMNLSSGIYFYQVQFDGNITTKRMLLLK